MRTFLEVVRTGSITRAGRNLGYSQSTAAAHIRALESQVGTSLFQRLYHGVRPTPDGETFHGYAVRLLGLVDELTTSLAGGREVSGRVSVGASPLSVDQELTRLVWECRYRYPKLELAPAGMDSQRITEEITAGRLDMGLILEPPDRGANVPAGLHTEDLRSVDVVAVAGRELLGILEENRLSTVRLLHVDSDDQSLGRFRAAIERAYSLRTEFMSIASVQGALELLRNGPCIAVLPRESVGREFENGEVGVVKGVPGERHVVRMVWNQQAWLPPALAATLELARRIGSPAATVT
ncbi:LysR family transcriptional regulator [Streptomyces sp. NPDC029674]|uniref:LysR family transcriptional regulator n=1 Tax=Streptomyces sp. NPDC029674 TaxID=3365297 RepID=UPI00384E0CEF